MKNKLKRGEKLFLTTLAKRRKNNTVNELEQF